MTRRQASSTGSTGNGEERAAKRFVPTRPTRLLLAGGALGIVLTSAGQRSWAQPPRPPETGRYLRADDASRPADGATGLRTPWLQGVLPGVVALASPWEYGAVAIPPPPGWTRTRAYGINAAGEVAARASNYDEVEMREVERQAVSWSPGAGTGVLPGLTAAGESGVWSINDNGFVAGYAFNASGFQRAVRWSPSTPPVAPTDLGTLAGGNQSTSYGLNAGGEVTGWAEIAADTFTPYHAIRWNEATGLLDLGTFDTTRPDWQFGYSISYDANAAGLVVGTASASEGGVFYYRAFVWDAVGGLLALPRDPAYEDPTREWYAVTINDAGRIGGHVVLAPGQSLPYTWAGSSSLPVGLQMPASFPYGEVYGINASGVMVGVMWNDAGEDRAFVYDAGRGVRDLNILLDPAEAWILEFARDINDSGQIVGSGRQNGEPRGFVLNPVALDATRYHPVSPCRLFDTREAGGESAAAPALEPGETRTFSVGTRCVLSVATIRSLSVNQTVASQTEDGELVLYRGDLSSEPITSSISWRAGKTRANNGLLELSRNGDGTFKVQNRSTGTVHFILDVNGLFR